MNAVRVASALLGIVCVAAAPAWAASAVVAVQAETVDGHEVRERARLAPTAGVEEFVAGTQAPDVAREMESLMAQAPDPTQATQPWAHAALAPEFDGAELAGEVTLRGPASVQQGFRMKAVGVWIDDQLLGMDHDVEDSWASTIDTARLLDGEHEVRVSAFAEPVLTGEANVAAVAWSTYSTVSTLNDPPVVLLYERSASVGGASSDVFAKALDESYVGLRVRFDATQAPAGAAPMEGLLQITYKEIPEAEGEAPEAPEGEPTSADADAPPAPTRSYVATYGLVEGETVVARWPYGVLAAPGTMTVTLAFVGMGRADVRVEAIALEAPDDGLDSATPPASG